MLGWRDRWESFQWLTPKRTEDKIRRRCAGFFLSLQTTCVLHSCLWLMKNLSSPAWIKTKGFLFLLLGVFSCSLLLVESHTWKTAILLVIGVWSFCRFYYFAFYVIERYVDPGYRFSGLLSFLRYLANKEHRESGV